MTDMTNTELIQKIKAEIERRIQRENEILWNAKKRGTYPSPSCDYNLLTLTSLRDFLSTIESEKPMNQEGLEEEMDKFFETMPVLEHENIFEDTFKNIARHFAKWGAEHAKEQMMKDYSDGKELLYVSDKSYKIGWHDCKEQMMKEAVEGRVISNDGISFPVSNEIHRLKLVEGDKVRIIIVKEEKQ